MGWLGGRHFDAERDQRRVLEGGRHRLLASELYADVPAGAIDHGVVGALDTVVEVEAGRASSNPLHDGDGSTFVRWIWFLSPLTLSVFAMTAQEATRALIHSDDPSVVSQF